MPTEAIAYFGPEGSFTHIVAQRRYAGRQLVPCRTIPEVFDYIELHHGAKGVVPIENSSGGAILQTIDGLIDHTAPARRLYIEEELSLDVQLALLGRKGRNVEVIYSHFAPLHHCEKWIKSNYPKARTLIAPSTSAAAELARIEENAASIGPIQNAEINGLDVLYFPIEENLENVTQFFVVGHEHHTSPPGGQKSSYVVSLPNTAGSLYEFLEPFASAKVNLTRLQSRPIVGHPNSHLFFIEVEGPESLPAVADAIATAVSRGASVESLGSYPVLPRYRSN